MDFLTARINPGTMERAADFISRGWWWRIDHSSSPLPFLPLNEINGKPVSCMTVEVWGSISRMPVQGSRGKEGGLGMEIIFVRKPRLAFLKRL